MSKNKIAFEQVHMDLINSWLLTLHEEIDNNVSLSEEQQAHLEAIVYGNISNFIEQFFNYPDYSNYN
jgi:hypothetical protein